MKICCHAGCDKRHYSKGYCYNHWRRIVWYPINRDRIIEYQRQYRIAHGRGYDHKCKVEGCNILTWNDYCFRHTKRIKNNQPLDLSIDMRKLNGGNFGKGKHNHRWNGGKSQYKRHAEIKRIRKQMILDTHSSCQKCGIFCGNTRELNLTYRDNNNQNLNADNLELLCHKCFTEKCKGRKNKNTAFIRKYKISVDELSKRLNISKNKLRYMDREKRLKKYLDKIAILGYSKGVTNKG